MKKYQAQKLKRRILLRIIKINVINKMICLSILIRLILISKNTIILSSKTKSTKTLLLLKTRVLHKLKISQNNKQNTIKALKNKQEKTQPAMKENVYFLIRKRMIIELQMLIVMVNKTKSSMIITQLIKNKRTIKRVINIPIQYRKSLKKITLTMVIKCKHKKIRIMIRKL